MCTRQRQKETESGQERERVKRPVARLSHIFAVYKAGGLSEMTPKETGSYKSAVNPVCFLAQQQDRGRSNWS